MSIGASLHWQANFPNLLRWPSRGPRHLISGLRRRRVSMPSRKYWLWFVITLFGLPVIYLLPFGPARWWFSTTATDEHGRISSAPRKPQSQLDADLYMASLHGDVAQVDQLIKLG